jgi:hypothetical protein
MPKLWSSNESGSMAPLGIGLFALSLAFVLVISAASSLFVFQKRLTNYAEMAAIYVLSHDAAVSDFQHRVGNQNLLELDLSQQILNDGLTVKITACAKWIASVTTYVSLPATRICSNASSRAG